LFDAAVAEFRKAGAAAADVGAAAGVARGTFYFHFPTKEHVLVEVEQREETRLAAALARYLRTPHDLASTLAEIVRLIQTSERTVGALLFRDVLGLHFLASRPASAQWDDHPLMVAIVDVFVAARERGETAGDVDALHSAMFFSLGVYGVLTTVDGSKSARAAVLEKFLASTLRSLQPRSA
jgi:AcrR family transcriptional regulator